MQLKTDTTFSKDYIKEIQNNRDDYLIEPFLDPVWINTWWKNIGINEYDEIKYLIFLKNNKPKIILPLVTRKIFNLKLVEMAGGKVSDYLSPIFDKRYKFTNEDIKFINQELFKNFKSYDLFFFRKQKNYQNYDNPLILLDKPILGLHKSYSIELNKFDLNKSIKKIFNDNKRQLKRLAAIGEVGFEVADDYKNKKEILEEMIAQKEQRYIKTNVWNMFASKHYKNFYKNLLNCDFDFVKLHVSAIKVDNNYISTHVGILDNKVFYYLMPSFDGKKFGLYSGGNILLENLINLSKFKNLEIFDFTIGGENYKKKWTNKTTDLFDVILTNSFSGKLARVIILVVFYLKKINIIDKLYKKLYKLINKCT